MKKVTIFMLFKPPKENLPKATLKVKKGHISVFLPSESSFDPYLWFAELTLLASKV